MILFFLLPLPHEPTLNLASLCARVLLYSYHSTSHIYTLFSTLLPPFTPTITMSKTFSQDDVASHGKGDSLWIIVDEDVYDLTKFQDEHPGKLTLG